MSESLQKTGKVIHVGEVETFGTFSKRLIVLECTDGQYQNQYAFQAIQDKVTLFDGLGEGDDITVSLNLGRAKYHDKSGRWFVDPCNVWKVDVDKSCAKHADVPAGPEEHDDQIPF